MSSEDKVAGLPLAFWLQFIPTILVVGIAWGSLRSDISHESKRRDALEARIETVRLEQMRTMRDEIGELKVELRRLTDRIDRALSAQPSSGAGGPR